VESSEGAIFSSQLQFVKFGGVHWLEESIKSAHTHKSTFMTPYHTFQNLIRINLSILESLKTGPRN